MDTIKGLALALAPSLAFSSPSPCGCRTRGAALVCLASSKVPFIENNISLIEFAREKVA